MKKARKYIPNPLFEQWITEWYEKAKAENKQSQYGFLKALNSLKKCPLQLETGKDCIILEHFGAKLCSMIDKKLEEHKKIEKIVKHSVKPGSVEGKSVSNCEIKISRNNVKTTRKKADIELDKRKDEKNDKEEIPNAPKKGTQSYVILEVLYEKQKCNPPGFMTRKQLSTEMGKRDFSLSQQDIHLSVIELISHGFANKTSAPISYSITETGISVMKSDEKNENKSEEISALDDSFQKFAEEASEPKPCEKLSRLSGVYSKIITEIDEKKAEEEKEEEATRKNKKNYIKSTEEEIKLKGNANSKSKVTAKTGNSKANSNKKGPVVETADFSENEQFVLEPGTFDVVLLVDIHETNQKAKPEDDMTTSRLTSLNTNFQIRHLNVGDFTWIARSRDTEKELVLPYVVERKSADDLSSSIRDGRFHEQKFRLKRCGIENQIYLVEGLNQNAITGIPLKSLYQAAINSLVQDDFVLKHTNSHKDSMTYLSLLTKSLTTRYKNKRLVSCKKAVLESMENTENATYLMDFAEFNKASSKVKVLRVQEMFIRQLAQLKGVSIDKALAIAQQFPTPAILQKALLESDENLLSDIRSDKKTIGSAISQMFHKFYTSRELN